MTLDIGPLIVAGILGFVLILIRFWRTIYLLFVKQHLIKANFRWASKFGRFKAISFPICDRIIEYLITIAVTFFSFYSAYLLRVKKTLDEQKGGAIELLKQAEERCASLEPILKNYTVKSTIPAYRHALSDSEVVTNYCNNSIVQSFYLTDVIKPEKTLTYLSARGFEVLSALEENQRVAHNNILDTTLSFLQRHISFIAFMKFEFLRDSLIRSERQKLQDSITLNKLENFQKHINKRDSIIYNVVNPFLPHQILLDTTEDKLDSIAETPEPDIEGASVIDSLWRYSYLMIGGTNGRPFISTNCFFIKQNKKLYLISTYHSLTSWNVWDTARIGAREPFYPDTLRLRLYSKGRHRWEYIPIDISKIKKDSKRIIGYSEPDIYFYQISDTSVETKYEINTVNRFLALDRDKYKKPTEAIVVGFSIPNSGNPNEILHLRAAINFSQIFGLYEVNLYYPALLNSDSINYRIVSPLNNFYWGSPVFFKELIPDVNNFKEVIIFGGVYTGTEQQNKSGMAVRPEQFLRRLAQLK